MINGYQIISVVLQESWLSSIKKVFTSQPTRRTIKQGSKKIAQKYSEKLKNMLSRKEILSKRRIQLQNELLKGPKLSIEIEAREQLRAVEDELRSIDTEMAINHIKLLSPRG